MTQNRYYSNVAVATTLSAALTTISTNVSVVSTTGWPTSFPFIIRIEPDTNNEELVLATSGLGTIGTPYVVTRAFDGTAARGHNNGVAAAHGFGQIDFAEPQTHLNLTGSASAAHGLPSSAWLGGSTQLISSVTLGSAGTISFSSIPGTFSHLRVVWMGTSSSGSGASDDIIVRFNGDSGTNYEYHYSYVQNSSSANGASSAGFSSTSGKGGTAASGNTNPTAGGAVGVGSIDIPFYSLSGMRRAGTFLSESFFNSTGANAQTSAGGFSWNSSSAITSILLGTTTGTTFTTGSRAFLYGIL